MFAVTSHFGSASRNEANFNTNLRCSKRTKQTAGSEPRSCFPTEFSSFIRGNQPASALCQGKAGRFPDA
jgi:hypothetical protein